MLEALSCVGQIIQDLRADLGDECEVGLVGVRLNHALYTVQDYEQIWGMSVR